MDKIIPISDLQTKAKKYVDQVKKTAQPIVITQRGRAAAVLVNYDDFEGLLAAQQEMTFGDWKGRLERARAEGVRGKGVSLDGYLEKRRAKA